MKQKIYSEFAQNNKMPQILSMEDLEQKIEENALKEEADNIILAEDKIAP